MIDTKHVSQFYSGFYWVLDRGPMGCVPDTRIRTLPQLRSAFDTARTTKPE